MSELKPVDIRYAAIDFLSRREHSRTELLQKLNRRFPDNALIETVLDELVEEGLQSDERYVEMFIRQRANRGYGPLRIRQEMREKGIQRDLVENHLYSEEWGWLQMAVATRQKKFGLDKAKDFKTQAKQMRFLQYRGFDSDTVRKVVMSESDE